MNIITQPTNYSVVYARSPIIYKFGGLNTGETYKYVIELRVYKTGLVTTPYDSTSIERKYDLLDGTPTITVDVSNLMYNWLRDNISYEQENIIRFNIRLHEYNNGVLTETANASYPYATLGYVQYVEATTTTTTTLPTCGYIAGNDIFYDADDPCVVGVQVGAPLFSDTGIFSTCTILTLWDCDQLATAGYYRQAGYWRYWNGFTFTDAGICNTFKYIADVVERCTCVLAGQDYNISSSSALTVGKYYILNDDFAYHITATGGTGVDAQLFNFVIYNTCEDVPCTTTTTTTSLAPTTTTTTTSGTTTTTTTTSIYDRFYIANEYNCSGCTLIRSGITMATTDNYLLYVGKFYSSYNVSGLKYEILSTNAPEGYDAYFDNRGGMAEADNCAVNICLA